MITRESVSDETLERTYKVKLIAAYVLTHVKSGSVYVGSTSHFIKRRQRHIEDLRNGKNANRELQRLYIEDPSITFDVYLVDDIEEAKDLEQQLISHHLENGTVLNIFHDVRSPGKGTTQSEEAKEHLRQLNLGKKQSPETIAKKVRAMTGRKLSEEHRARMSSYLTGVPKTVTAAVTEARLKRAKSVSIEGVVYSGLRKASVELGLSRTVIKRRLASDKWEGWFFV